MHTCLLNFFTLCHNITTNIIPSLSVFNGIEQHKLQYNCEINPSAFWREGVIWTQQVFFSRCTVRPLQVLLCVWFWELTIWWNTRPPHCPTLTSAAFFLSVALNLQGGQRKKKHSFRFTSYIHIYQTRQPSNSQTIAASVTVNHHQNLTPRCTHCHP